MLRRVTILGSAHLTAAILLVFTSACGGKNSPPEGGKTAPGENRSLKTAVLENGAPTRMERLLECEITGTRVRTASRS